jgi:hypothetical protein
VGQFWRAPKATLRETGAWFNFEILQILEDREERDLAYFGRIRHELEKALAGSGKRAASPNPDFSRAL